ncbi:anthranilate synthase component II [Engelhardtia mirabilis]|uniref:Aminodeoxychorismate synthase component 2 n=1 Tax=Engelhardtia mirabilis TaxID=2528011 RepID=A0A518BM74_9BACT|nr:Aminodeoxychorismate synthase component 2 [Planctomycetes bacterium Pla133]QDV02414.1 Aminodeoxychorismate synthase component 2 [Planctomycetes bacterium Pla86]
MILLLDHRDSFTFNVAQGLLALGAKVEVVRLDGLEPAELLARKPTGVVLGPGPGHPAAAHATAALVRMAPPDLPLLGICLGHQVLAQVHGARVVRAPRPEHGRADRIDHDGRGLFLDLPSTLEVGRYHSLAVDPASLPAELELAAWSSDGCPMALRHRHLPHDGLQFHPDSILSECGQDLFARWLERVGDARQPRRSTSR